MECLDCPVGTRGSQTKAVSCDPCPAGINTTNLRFVNNSNLFIVCVIVSSGTFGILTQSLQAVCVPCGPGNSLCIETHYIILKIHPDILIFQCNNHLLKHSCLQALTRVRSVHWHVNCAQQEHTLH